MDTLYAESNHLRPIIEKFRNGQQDLSTAVLAKLLGLDVSADKFRSEIENLVYCGFVRGSGIERWSIGELYLPSLAIRTNFADQRRIGHHSDASVDVARARAENLFIAREYGDAFAMLVNERNKPPQNMCLLADIAFGSGESTLIGAAREVLEGGGEDDTRAYATLLARRVALASTLGDRSFLEWVHPLR